MFHCTMNMYFNRKNLCKTFDSKFVFTWIIKTETNEYRVVIK